MVGVLNSVGEWKSVVKKGPISAHFGCFEY